MRTGLLIIRTLICLLSLSVCNAAFARHGKGGYLTYEYLGNGVAPNTSKYKITVLHYVNCKEVQFETGLVYIGIFDGVANNYLRTITVTNPVSEAVNKLSFDVCLNPPPVICFYKFTYTATVELVNNTSGYVLTEQECCRAESIANIANSGASGSTNTNTIPGVINGVAYRNNSSPVPALKDTAVVCHNAYFQIDFGSVDPDGDALTYNFCTAEAGGSRQDRQPNPPSPPPYLPVTYLQGYSPASPMGSKVIIDSKTGIISGIAPAATGQYVIAVCINEMRNGVKIGNTKKEVLITVADCSLAAAVLKPEYINCDSLSMMFENESSSSNISEYAWDFGVPEETTDVSASPTPLYTYAKAGTYSVKLKVLSDAGCTDSATAVVKVYPGFSPDFSATGSCYQSPFVFTDKSYAAYGNIDSWAWNFGDASSTNTSSAQNTTHLFSSPTNTTVTLAVTSSVGCSGSMSKTVVVNDKPEIKLPFTDTLICNGDLLPLNVQSSGDTYSWSPIYNISNAAIANPVVKPADTTIYTIVVKDKSCIDSAKLTINVLDFITVKLPADTAICATDEIIFHPVSDALQYNWSEAAGSNTLSNSSEKNPKAAPLRNTEYFVTANLGHCQDKAQINVLVSPYPAGNAGNDVTICYGRTVKLNASTTAAYYNWSPASSLSGANTLHPTAGPQATTAYAFTVKDSFYCPKSTADTIIVKVIPPVLASAGNDTAVVYGQPLQLHAGAAENVVKYTWSPSLWLNDPHSENPVANIQSSYTDSIIYTTTVTTSEGCTGEDAVTVFLYKTLPDIFIPTAFTPNGDGLNDVFKPIMAGIAQLNYFRVYDRRGELLYETAHAGSGWDGTFKGVKQPAGAYVYAARCVDYLGKILEKKGTVVLIR